MDEKGACFPDWCAAVWCVTGCVASRRCRHLDESIITLHPDWPVVRSMFRLFGAVYTLQSGDSRVKVMNSNSKNKTAPLRLDATSGSSQLPRMGGLATPPRFVTIGNAGRQPSSRRNRLQPIELDQGPTPQLDADEGRSPALERALSPALGENETKIRSFDSQKVLESKFLKGVGKATVQPVPARVKRASIAIVPVFTMEEVPCCPVAVSLQPLELSSGLMHALLCPAAGRRRTS